MLKVIDQSAEETIEDYNVCFVNGPVDADMTNYVYRFIMEKNLIDTGKPKPDHLKMLINSPGGIISDCLAMVDLMNAYPIPIWTYGMGMVASCGLILFLSGQKGNRYLFKNASILSHQWSGMAEGKEHEIRASEKENKMITKRMYNIYESATGLSKEDIHKHLLPPEDVWLSPSEAVKYHLADKVVTKF